MNELLNTDKELWRAIEGDAYSPSIFVTDTGNIGINVGGHVTVLSVEKWHDLEAELQRKIETLTILYASYDELRERLTELEKPRPSNSVLVPCDKLKEMQDHIAELEQENNRKWLNLKDNNAMAARIAELESENLRLKYDAPSEYGKH